VFVFVVQERGGARRHPEAGRGEGYALAVEGELVGIPLSDSQEPIPFRVWDPNFAGS
jgi:hypothetical protein